MALRVIAKDTARNNVLLAGLGWHGGGKMWTRREAGDRLPGFGDAPEDPDQKDIFGDTSADSERMQIRGAALIAERRQGKASAGC